MTTVFERLETRLRAAGAKFEVSHHAPVSTSEEAARVRGTSLASGAKALVCKADDRFILIVLPADRKLASKRMRKECGIGSLRFATREELFELTGLAPGSVPPLGSLFNLETWCDAALGENEMINFNAGDHAVSISIPYSEYIRAEQPILGSFSELPTELA